ncbi:hypothetical protein B0T11DRAFT_333120 [Plectosphaerella cucumerina]|uniref:F-box domain-containing protein n=1 Tax=Plectosphaerella cucumerina TaxID=40658 RepID=A0A8K0T737_9PEZI|nr:hypothetical protein B0T11DRAFT_333120 [Plectosphaerella cucumerina]
MGDLPTELVLLICKHLPLSSIVDLARTSRNLYDICLPEVFTVHPRERRTALIWACKNGFVNTTRLAVDAGANVDGGCLDEQWLYPLGRKFNFALDTGSGMGVAKGVTFSVRKTPLALAIMNGHVDVLNLLRANRVIQEWGLRMMMEDEGSTDPADETWIGECSPFLLVRDMPMYRALKSTGLRDGPNYFNEDLPERENAPRCLPTLSWLIIRKAEVEVIKAAIEDGHALLTPTAGEIPPLVLACQYGHYDAALYLIEQDLIKVTPDNEADFSEKPWNCYNAGIWYGLHSLESGFWNNSTEKLIRFLRRCCDKGLDVNNVTFGPSQAPLLHLAMLPHVDASVVEALLSLGADPCGLAPVKLEDYSKFAYGAYTAYLHGLPWPTRPRETYSQESDPLEALLGSLEKPWFEKIPCPGELSGLHCFLNGSMKTSHFESNQRRKLTFYARWAVLRYGCGFLVKVFEQSKSFVYPLTLLREVSKLVDLKDPIYRDIIQSCLGEDSHWIILLDGTLDAIATGVDLCSAHKIDFVEYTQDTTADNWSTRYLSSVGCGHIPPHTCPRSICKYCMLLSDVDGRLIDMDVDHYPKWEDMMSNWMDIDEAYKTSLWKLFRKEVHAERSRNESKIILACLKLDHKVGRVRLSILDQEE